MRPSICGLIPAQVLPHALLSSHEVPPGAHWKFRVGPVAQCMASAM
ncbi:hypothetical protein [Corallococcus sp. bb12-1]|nr:hypothetical protein [Corallococcus sp. bb12-1]